jgi:Ankyrin repeat
MAQPWLISNLATATNPSYNKKRDELVKAANNGYWDDLLNIINQAQTQFDESWANVLTDTDGWTPLHFAAYQNVDPNTIKMFLQNGAWRALLLRCCHTGTLALRS